MYFEEVQEVDGFTLQAVVEAPTGLFSSVQVTISREEYIGLRRDVGYWKVLHSRAVERESALKGENERLRARIRDLERRLFGRKSERTCSVRGERFRGYKASGKPRGQKCGKGNGHGRTLLSHLPVREEEVDVPEEEKQCPICGLSVMPFLDTDDSEIVEIEVQAYRRTIRRKRYRPSCGCGQLPGIMTAPPVNRLIPKGKLGISVWVTVILDKFLYYRPTHRLLQDLKGHGLFLSQGTITGGLQAIAPLFAPIESAMREKQLTEDYWHADETRWEVFEMIVGKVGYRWYLWVYQSQSTVVYTIAPTRAATVPEAHFKDVSGGVLICDRYRAYKKLARKRDLQLAFCWAHVRRDFLSIARDWKGQETWAMAWVDRIRELYRLNEQRLEVRNHRESFVQPNDELQKVVNQMETQWRLELGEETVHPARKKVLKSLKNHWDGLTLFLDDPNIPLDNNAAERSLRGPVVGRKNFYGSGSQWSASLAATMFTVLQTLELWGINQRVWMDAYLHACADNCNRPPEDLRPFLPWSMDKTQLAQCRLPPPAKSPVGGRTFDFSAPP